VSRDTICFNKGGDKNGCLDRAIFLAVDSATDIDKDRFSGIIGLGPMGDVARVPAFVEQASGMGGIAG